MSKLSFDGDALWMPVLDGGSLRIIDGEAVRSGGLQAAVYISLFGGNDADDGATASRSQFWGNHLGNDEPIRGRLGTLIRTIPMVSESLARIEATAALDLAWMVDNNIATGVTVDASMRLARWLHLDFSIEMLATTTEHFKWRLNWASGPFEPSEF